MKKFDSIYEGNLELFIHKNLTNRPSPIFYELEELAISMRVPILSPATGEVLQYIILKESPSQVLELGTGIGYSTLWMLSANIPMYVESWERNTACISTAEFYIKKLILENQNVVLKNFHILDKIKKTDSLENFDIIFIDCDKICYPDLLDVLPKKMKKNSILLFDNVLWHGRLNPLEHTRPSDKAIQKFWEKVSGEYNNRTLFPVGDGLLLIRL